MKVVREDLKEGSAILGADEAVMEDAGDLVGKELSTVVFPHHHRLIGLQQALNHLKHPQ